MTGKSTRLHEPTQVDRDTVAIMVAGGISQEDIARARGITTKTLRKHYHEEITNGAVTLNTMVIIEHIKKIKAGDFAAIKWWQQTRMRWREHIVLDDGKPADAPMRVVVEFLGEAAVGPTIDGTSTRREGLRLVDNVELVG